MQERLIRIFIVGGAVGLGLIGILAALSVGLIGIGKVAHIAWVNNLDAMDVFLVALFVGGLPYTVLICYLFSKKRL